jgi:pseudouridylate synthase / pseudouridine kinase
VYYGTSVIFTSEPTSVPKAASALLAVSKNLKQGRPPLTFASPNRLELRELCSVAQETPFNLMDRAEWWSALDGFSLNADFRDNLELLCRQPVNDFDPTKGNLESLLSQGTIQMAVRLLPFIRHVIVKMGSEGLLVVFHIPSPSNAASGWMIPSDPHKRTVTVHGKSGTIVIRHFPPSKPMSSVNVVTGAGDTLVCHRSNIQV